MNAQQREKVIRQYIIDAIDPNAYNEKAKTDAEKLRFIDRVFHAEYGWAIPRYGYVRAMKEWMQGLPTALNIEFYNHDILIRGREWGMIRQNASEKSEDEFINAWFDLLANKTTRMIREGKP